MLLYLKPYFAYLFAVVVGIILMWLEHQVSDSWMIVLICAALIAHVWLTRRAVNLIVQHDRSQTVDATLTALHLVDRGARPRSE